MQVAEESMVGGTKIAVIAGRNLKYSNCEQIGGFSDLAVPVVWSLLASKLLKIHSCRLS